MPEHYSRIFLLSHMRAYTSLAGHILGSHPRINGYSEMHISYDDASALDKQVELLRQHETLKQDSHYLFDKLLHNDYRLDPGRLGLSDFRILISLRQPEPAITSIADLFDKKETDELYASPVVAADYYIERINWLADFCRSDSLPYHYYDAELFQAAPEWLLGRLTDWLDLDSPLSGRYQLFSQTGKAGTGDSSRLIHSGKIEKIRFDYSHIRIPEDVLGRAQEAYRICRSMIMANATYSVAMPVERVSH